MAFKRLLAAIIGQSAVFGCGVAAMAAWRDGLYATLALALLAGIWLVSLSLLRVWPARVVTAQPMLPEAMSELMVMRVVLDQTPTPLLSIDADQRVRTINRAARALFAADDTLLVPSADALSGPHVSQGGRRFRIDRIEAHGAGPARTIVSLIDIESEERMAEARATRDLLQVMSHEVMNALTPIASLSSSAMEMLNDRPVPIDRLRDMAGTLERRARGLLRFTEDYRELARLPEPVLESVPLSDLFDDLAIMFQARWGTSVDLAIDSAAHIIVHAEPAQLTQAIWAVLQNAGEAPRAASIAPRVQIEAQATGPVTITVTDNGTGMDAAARDAAFKPFFTTKATGSGIGLSLSRQILRGHGGDLHIDAGHAQGCRMVMILPGA